MWIPETTSYQIWSTACYVSIWGSLTPKSLRTIVLNYKLSLTGHKLKSAVNYWLIAVQPMNCLLLFSDKEVGFGFPSCLVSAQCAVC